MACESGPAYRVIALPENQYQNFSRLVAGSEKWLAYPEENKVLLFSSLEFSSADDSIVVSDSVWDYCIDLWKIRCEQNGEDIYEIQRPTGFAAERFADLNIDRVRIFGDSLLFCLMKLCYTVKSSKRDGLFAIFPLVCFDLNSRTIRKEYSVLHTFDDSKKPYVRDISVQLEILYRHDGFHYLAYGMLYDSSGRKLSYSNEIDMVSIKTNKARQICKTDTFPKIIDYDIERDEILVGVRDQLQRYKDGTLLEIIETGLKPHNIITDNAITEFGNYYLVYEYLPALHASVYKKNTVHPIYSEPYESASIQFQYWNGHHYFFYDKDAVTHVIEFK